MLYCRNRLPLRSRLPWSVRPPSRLLLLPCARPTRLRSSPSDLLSGLRAKTISSSNSTPQSALPAARTRLRFFGPILDLAGGDIDDHLAELDRVARTFEALGCHASNMARCRASANPASRVAPGLL